MASSDWRNRFVFCCVGSFLSLAANARGGLNFCLGTDLYSCSSSWSEDSTFPSLVSQSVSSSWMGYQYPSWSRSQTSLFHSEPFWGANPCLNGSKGWVFRLLFLTPSLSLTSLLYKWEMWCLCTDCAHCSKLNIIEKNRASDNGGKFHTYLKCRIWIYNQKGAFGTSLEN